MRAYAVAMQPPKGPVYVSIPLDDWDQPALGEAIVRTASSRYSPDPERLAHFAGKIQKSKNPVLLYGPEIERAGGWDAGIKFAERLKAPVYISPLSLMVALAIFAGLIRVMHINRTIFLFPLAASMLVETLSVAGGTGARNRCIERHVDVQMRHAAHRPLAAGGSRTLTCVAIGSTLVGQATLINHK